MMKLKTVALIPARYASTRLPAKLVQDLGGKSVIQQTFLSVIDTDLFDRVVVATDHELIADQIKALGGEVFLSQKLHESGSDRIAEAAKEIDADIVINIQGDEPFLDRDTLEKLIKAFDEPMVKVASVMCQISKEAAHNPNAVKVVLDQYDDALYFSRSLIPYDRDGKHDQLYWKHIGIYAYRKDVLLDFTVWPKSKLEQIEMLEQLRLLERGIKIRMVRTEHQALAIDTAEDLELARMLWK